MRKSYQALLAGAALAAVGTAAHAQFPFDLGGYGQPYGQPYGYGNPDTAILYEYPNYQGRSVTVTRERSNLADINFNDRTRSSRVQGSWRICEDAGYRSRCETVNGSVPDLTRMGFHGISSVKRVGSGSGGYPGYPGGGYPGYPGGGYGPSEGRSVVFYPGPAPTAGYGSPYGQYGGTRRTADEFCRQMGHRISAYYDTSGGVLSDVLCRR